MTRFFITLPLFLASLVLFFGEGSRVVEARSFSRKFGNNEVYQARSIAGHAAVSKIEAREVEQAVELLRRANYDFFGHVNWELEKRGSKKQHWTMVGGGYTCQCSGSYNGGYNDGGSSGGGSHGGGSNGGGSNGGGSNGGGSHGGGSNGGGSNGGGSNGGGSNGGGSNGGGSNGGGSNGGGSNGGGSCPSGYHTAHGGDVIQVNDGDLVDLKGLSINLDILNFNSNGKQGSKGSVPANDRPKCQSDVCCWKPVGSCPQGYSYVGHGDVIQYNDGDLIDAKGLSINLDILNFFKDNSQSKQTKPASEKPTCDAKACCVKPVPGGESSSCPAGYEPAKEGDVIQVNDADLIDLKDVSINLNILNFGSDNKQSGQTTAPASKKPRCESKRCCYKAEKGESKDDKKPKTSCPKGYSTAHRGDVMQVNDPDLVDLKDLSVSIHILDFSSSKDKEVKNSKSTCDEDTCCFKPSVKQVNDGDLVDAKGAKVNLCLLSSNCGSK